MERKAYNILFNIYNNLNEMLSDLDMLIGKSKHHNHNLSLVRENVKNMHDMVSILIEKHDCNVAVKLQILDAKSRRFLRDTHSLIQTCECDFL